MSAPAETRFATSPATLALDRLMTWVITAGGIAIILAVCGIFVFITKEVIPLFAGASATALESRETGVTQALAFGCDEWGERPFVLGSDGRLHILNGPDGATEIRDLGVVHASAASWSGEKRHLAIGTADGSVAVYQFDYSRSHEDGSVSLQVQDLVSFDLGEHAVAQVVYDDDGSKRLVCAVFDDGTAVAVPIKQKLAMGRPIGKPQAGDPQVVPIEHAQRILVAASFDLLVAQVDGDTLVHLVLENGAWVELDRFKPFPGGSIATVGWLFGDQSLVLVGDKGENVVYALSYARGGDFRTFDQTKELPPLGEPATAFAQSTRNKAYFLATETEVSLRFATTERVRWEAEAAEPIAQVAINSKYSRLFTLTDDGTVQGYALDDPHPDGGMTSLFGRVHYEGSDEPEWRWESTGGSDDFEPKLSMMPLIWGTLKGTFYAMLFAMPIAILAALYTSEFMHPRFKTFVKPTMEIMASLPSVVLGYIAAQVLAPVLENRVPATVAVAVALPLAAMLFGAWWARRPMRIRSHIRNGYEWLVLLPIGLLVGVFAWQVGIVLDRSIFVHVNPETGVAVDSIGAWLSAFFSSGDQGQAGSFRIWFNQVFGLSYEQRNSLVVGLIMGFAVIPIIFTITEDALSNVPKALRSASLALGATRWQTAIRVVLPTASAGIFSAVMIGLGRAIGETMIVVMATGNTAIMTMNPFDGMRTLSANIAVELPEAAHGGTLYRTLFFGALLLFLMTFVINTAAELMRQHLRDKYKTV